MSLTNSLDALCDLLARRTGLSAQVGMPGDATDGLFVWPYRLMPSATSGASTARNVRLTARRHIVDVPALVFAPGPAHVANLESVMTTLLASPVIPLVDDAVRVTMDARLSLSDLSGLFAAAHVQQVLVLEVVLHVPIDAGPRVEAPNIDGGRTP